MGWFVSVRMICIFSRNIIVRQTCTRSYCMKQVRNCCVWRKQSEVHACSSHSLFALVFVLSLSQGECILSGTSNCDLLYIASSVDGSIIDTVDTVEGRREKTLYMQSLRGRPLPNAQGQNRCAVLVCFKAHTERPYDLIEVNLNRDPTGAPRDLPFSLGSIRTLVDDHRKHLTASRFADVVFSCQESTGDQLIYAHQAVLRARWKWCHEHA